MTVPRFRDTYADLFAVGGVPFLGAGFAARLPTAILPLAVLLYAHESSGSFAIAGLAVAGLSIGGAVGGPAIGALAQRWHPSGALAVATGAAAAVLVAMVVTDGSDLPPALLIALASLLGAANGQVGALVRARWSRLLAGRDDPVAVQTAMAYETVVDEVSFVVGPVLAGTLAGVWSPRVALTSALVLLLAQAALAPMLAHDRHLDSARSTRRAPLAAVARWLVLGGCAGAVFGIVQTGLTALLTERGQQALVGLVYASVGVGSAVSGALTPMVWARLSVGTRVRLSGVILAASGLLFAVSPSTFVLALACAVVGLAVAPVQITAFHEVERGGRPGDTMAVTVLSTAMVSGVAAGAALAGLLVDRYSGPMALLAVTGVGVAVMLTTLGVGDRKGGGGRSAERVADASR